MNKTTRLHMLIPAELKARLEKLAKLYRRSLAAQITIMLERAIVEWENDCPNLKKLDPGPYK